MRRGGEKRQSISTCRLVPDGGAFWATAESYAEALEEVAELEVRV